MSHFDVTNSNFSYQYPINVDQAIQKMENVIETIGGRISTKYYKQRMVILMNNFRHKCKKLILDRKYRESSLTPKEWEYLKETLCSEDYLETSTRGKKSIDILKV